MTTAVPAPQESTSPQPGSRNLYLLWGVCISILAAFALFCWLVVAPVMRVREEVMGVTGVEVSYVYSRLEDVLPLFSVDALAGKESIEVLGGESRAAYALSLYLNTPRFLAPDQHKAAALLGFCGKFGVGPARSALKDDRLRVRAHAAMAISRVGPDASDAVPELTSVLDDPSELVRDCACRALGSIGPAAASAVQKLEEVEKSGRANTAAEALEKIKGKVKK